ncbi:alpha-L-fucosidase 2 [Rhizobium sp. PP-F2F-G38]|uniref:glycoside hydrolase family 95 protein n=1 Tax=Rhizobium sp. PP-CC-3G-465 TaxID=2135648 RepID=UPI000DA01D92|nr:alpha-L-fucosidase 2 [Rhizobium sp. PP-WC-1G-195]PYE93315.1 alpha-L-fucosidase 2 [Rhizobium sp. PP-F2F-G38]TCQ17225.1 alpha-L-fucosidase 2 [Rhizobium sp. PP-CC-3G-465]
MTTHELWYDRPASAWTEALPVGNGRLGAMVFGGAWSERLQINESTFWNGGPYQPINAQAGANIGEVRKLILEGRYAEAERLAYEKVMASPDLQTSYQPVGDVQLTFHHDLTTENYRRSLDLDAGIATTLYDCRGVRFRRDVFATAIHNVLVCRITVSKPGALSMGCLMSSPQNGAAEERSDDTIGYLGRNRSQNGIPGLLRFAFRARVLSEGGMRDRGPEAVRVREADAVTLLIDVGTSFRRYDDVSGAPDEVTAHRLDEIAAIPYQTLLHDHLADHRRLYRSMSIAIDGPDTSDIPTDRRIAAFASGDDPDLAALYVRFGRYLALASSRPGTQPANLQGIWNEEILPPWNSKYTVNINLQMNYWLADPANLPETFIPLIELVEDVAETGREMAREHYGARGWVLHHNTDIWRATGPIDGPPWGLWPMGGAWLCVQIFDHWRFHPNQPLLERIFPLIKGAVDFMLDTLVTLPGTDLLVTCPSLSPENSHPFGSTLCAGPAMDSQILRDLFAAAIEACKRLDVEAAWCETVRAARARLPADRIGQAGQLQEWLEDWDVDAPEPQHRHVSHLYGVYPSLQIDTLVTPDLTRAAEVSLDRRGDDATGWGIGWRLNLWARLGRGARAHDVLALLLSPERTYPNLFDAHPPFQIDGNFGGAAGVLEMFVQSRVGEIRLLPALPSTWPAGRISGIRVRGGMVLDLTWDQGKVQSLTLTAEHAGTAIVRHTGEVLEIFYGEGINNVNLS